MRSVVVEPCAFDRSVIELRVTLSFPDRPSSTDVLQLTELVRGLRPAGPAFGKLRSPSAQPPPCLRCYSVAIPVNRRQKERRALCMSYFEGFPRYFFAQAFLTFESYFVLESMSLCSLTAVVEESLPQHNECHNSARSVGMLEKKLACDSLLSKKEISRSEAVFFYVAFNSSLLTQRCKQIETISHHLVSLDTGAIH